MCAQVNHDSIERFYKERISRYLDKTGFSKDFVRLTSSGIEIIHPATDTSEAVLEYSVSWDDLSQFKELLDRMSSLELSRHLVSTKKLPTVSSPAKPTALPRTDPGLPLKGIRIALDPGHIAGDLELAKQEKKWVEMKNPPVQIIEGELTLATALILREKLEKLGAVVMLTRDKAGVSSFGVDYATWKDSLFKSSVRLAYERQDIDFEEMQYLQYKAKDLEIFRRFFLQEDLRERAKKINAFNPHLTLIIHYNVDETNVNWNRPTKKNYNMAFVGGAFTPEELSRPEDKIEFLRLLLTDELEKSIQFSGCMMDELVKHMSVPAALDSNAIYLRDNCMNTQYQGVFHRNLTLTRKVRGVVCYGESLYQDNVKECALLSKKEIKVGEKLVPKRVEVVANAYLEGLLKYLKVK